MVTFVFILMFKLFFMAFMTASPMLLFHTPSQQISKTIHPIDKVNKVCVTEFQFFQSYSEMEEM